MTFINLLVSGLLSKVVVIPKSAVGSSPPILCFEFKFLEQCTLFYSISFANAFTSLLRDVLQTLKHAHTLSHGCNEFGFRTLELGSIKLRVQYLYDMCGAPCGALYISFLGSFAEHDSV